MRKVNTQQDDDIFSCHLSSAAGFVSFFFLKMRIIPLDGVKIFCSLILFKARGSSHLRLA